MIVSAVQCDVSAPEKIAQMIGGNAGSDLYVLPEMWNTGFTVNPQADAIAESEARIPAQAVQAPFSKLSF